MSTRRNWRRTGRVIGGITILAFGVGVLVAATGPSFTLTQLFPTPVACCEVGGIVRPPAGNVFAAACGVDFSTAYCHAPAPNPSLAAQIHALNPLTGSIQNALPLDGAFGDMTWDGANVWVANHANGQLVKLDLNPMSPTYGVIGTLPAPGDGKIGGFAYDGSNFWVHAFQLNTVFRISPVNGSVLQTINNFPIPSNALNGMEFLNGSLYVTVNDESALPDSTGGPAVEGVARIDPNSLQVVDYYAFTPPLEPMAMGRDYVDGGFLIMMKNHPSPLFPMQVYRFLPSGPPIPAVGAWGLMLLAAALAIVGYVVSRRVTRTAVTSAA